MLQNELKQLKSKEPEIVEKIVEKIIEKEVPVEVEKPASGDLKEAAHLMSMSELNKEDLTEKQILDMLQKSSDEEVKRKLGFWAVQLPKTDVDKEPTNKKYR
jgi:hypothetical protein